MVRQAHHERGVSGGACCGRDVGVLTNGGNHKGCPYRDATKLTEPDSVPAAVTIIGHWSHHLNPLTAGKGRGVYNMCKDAALEVACRLSR